MFFAVAVVVFGRWRGLFALVGLAISFGVLVRFMLPAILVGKNPVAVAVVGSAAIMFVTLYLTHGVNARTTTAVLGTVGALFLTGVLAWVFVAGTHLTGMATEESGLLAASLSGVSLQGLLLGGIVIGSLGVLDDVTVTQASAVWELHRANPEYGFHRLYAAGLRIGRDHIASTVNTLVMAYAGASLPLLVLFTLSSRRLGDVLTSEIVGPGDRADAGRQHRARLSRADHHRAGRLRGRPQPAPGAARGVAGRLRRRRIVLPGVGQLGQAAGEAAEVVDASAGVAQGQAEDEGGQGGGRPGDAVSGVAGQVEEHGHGLPTEDGGVGR